MKSVQQISVFLENKAGRLAAAAAALKESGVNIRALTIADAQNYGILRLIVNKPDETVTILKNAGFVVKQNPMLAIEVDDQEGILYNAMKLCNDKSVNVEYMYSFVEQTSKKAILFLRVGDTEAAERLFSESGYTLLSSDEVCKI